MNTKLTAIDFFLCNKSRRGQWWESFCAGSYLSLQ